MPPPGGESRETAGTVPPIVLQGRIHAWTFKLKGWAGQPLFAKVFELVSGNFLNAVLGAILGIYVARILGPDDKGVLALIVGSTGLLTMVFGLGTPHAASYFIRKKPETARSIFFYMDLSQAAGTMLALGLVLTGGDFFTKLFLDGHHLESFVLWLVIGSIATGSGYAMFGSCVIARGDSRRFAGISLFATVLNLLLAFCLLSIFPQKLRMVLLASFLGQAAAYFLYRRKCAEYIPASGGSKLSVLEFFMFGSKVQIGSLSNLFFKRADLFILGFYLDVAAVGYYSIGLSLRELATIIPRSLSGIVGGELADAAVPPERKAKLLKRSLAGATVFSTALAGVCTLAFPIVIPLLYTESFRPAVLASILLMWSFIPFSAAIILGAALTAAGKPLAWSLGNTISACIAGLSVWSLTRSHGLLGAGVAAIVGTSVQLAICAGIYFLSAPKRDMLPSHPKPPMEP